MPNTDNQPGRSRAAHAQGAANTKRILIVDDSNSVRGVLREALELQAGFICEEAANGIDAVQIAKKIMPDLIILDLAMPKLNGFEVAMVLKREMPKIPVVILTMYAESFGRSLADSFGVKAVIDKSDGVTALLSCVQNLLRA